MEFTFRYKVEGQLGINSKIFKANSQTEADNIFAAWIQIQAENGFTIIPF